MSLHQPIPLSRPAPMLCPTLPLYDSSMDVTDSWNERNDPENEEGATVTAFFEHSHDHGQTQATMIGLTVEEYGETFHYTAFGAIFQLGIQSVRRIELVHGETLQ